MALQINEENYAQLKGSGKPMVIDFWATWCGPCRRMAPIIEELAGQYEGQVNIGKCDVEECEDLATEYKVTSIPTIVLLNAQGEVANRLVGLQSKAKLEEEIGKLL